LPRWNQSAPSKRRSASTSPSGVSDTEVAEQAGEADSQREARRPDEQRRYADDRDASAMMPRTNAGMTRNAPARPTSRLRVVARRAVSPTPSMYLRPPKNMTATPMAKSTK
jgi:hypothetical protein